MRLRTLEIQGFGPFKAKQVIDFTQFANDGMFLIEGETGAGKSSILDAITWALYSFTARWIDSSANAEFKSVRSHFCEADDLTRVQLVFELSAGAQQHTYRIERSIPGLKKDGSEKPVVARLFEILNDGSEIGIASTVSTVASEISKLVRLDSTEFLQVVLLAQGRFQAFLEATSDKRLELLRKLFDTRRFADIQAALSARASDLEAQMREEKQELGFELSALSQAFNSNLPVAGDEIHWVHALLKEINHSIDIAEGEVAKSKLASETAAERSRQAQEQLELAKLKDEKKVQESRLKEHRANAEQLKSAQKAAKVAGLWFALSDLESELDDAKAALLEIPLDSRISRDLNSLKAQEKVQLRLVEKLEQLIEQESSITDLQDSLDALNEELLSLQQTLTEAENEVLNLRGERADLEKLVGDVSALKNARDAAKTRLEQFLGFQALGARRDVAHVKLKVAEEELRKSTEAQLAFIHDYQSNLAASLASELVDGQPCLVCGSTNHPAKAEAAGELVTDEQVNTANEVRSAADAAFGSAKAEFERLTEEFDLMSPEFQGQSQESISEIFNEAEASFNVVSLRQARLEEIKTALDSNGELQQKISALTPEVSAKKVEIRTVQAELAKTSSKVLDGLGGFKSISEHKESAAQLLEAMSATLSALEAVRTKTEAREKANKQFESKLKTEGFQSPRAFQDAYLNEDLLEALQAKVQIFNEEVTRLETLLGEPRFKLLPKVTIDLTSAQIALSEAESQLSIATQKFGALQTQKQILVEAKARISGLMPRIEKFSDDYETHIGLASIVNGKSPNTLRITLESYFAASELEVILEAANAHLKSMAAGSQYTLQHSDKALKGSGKAGLGIVVLDEYTSRERQPETLSGGEKFQVSLAIALGLAQVVSDRSGAIRVDTLFVDEGFASLSTQVLDTAMRTLDSLKQGGRTIGLISHVERMQEEISAKLKVEKTPRGPSLILQNF